MTQTGSHAGETAAAAIDGLRLELAQCRGELDSSRRRIAELEHSERLLAGEDRLWKMIARGALLSEILTAHCQLVEELSPRSQCGILLYDQANNRVEPGAAPSLPEDYNDAIHHRIVTPEAGPCGLALCLKEQVIAADIATDLRWQSGAWRALALAHGLRACWSTPILSFGGNVLGAFAIYWREPRCPTEQDQRLLRQLTHLAAVAIDRRWSEELLRQSERRFTEAVDTVPGLVWSGWPDGGVDFLNKRWREYTGLTHEQAQGWGWRAAIHPEDLPGLETYWRTVLAAGQPGEIEARLRRADGAFRWFLFRAAPVHDDAGKLVKWYGQNIDIDDRKCAEQALRAAKTRVEGILEVADDAIISVNSAQQIVFFNPSAEKIFGYGQSEVIGQPLEVLLPNQFTLAHRRHFEAFGRSPKHSRLMSQHRDAHGVRKDGSEFPVEASISRLNLSGETHFTVILRDNTERKRAEAALLTSENRFRTIVDTIPGMICTLNPAGQVELLSRQVLEYFGKPTEELKNWAMTDAIHPDDLPWVIEQWKRSVASGEPFDSEQRQRRADGVYRWQHSRALPARDEQGRITGWYMLITDIDELKHAANALRSSEQFARGQGEALRHILDALAHESSPDRIVEHVLRTITGKLTAPSCRVWSKDARTGLLHFAFSLVAGEFQTNADARYGATFPSERVKEIWPGVDLFDSGQPQIVEDIRAGPDFLWRSDLLAQGIISVLVVPMQVVGQVRGIVEIQFDRKRPFQPEEVQLAQTLANQAMLAMQLSRISAQSRQAAVLAERNRLARDIHDTLAQGFTGVIVQLEAADDATAQGLANEAGEHVRRAGALARESLQEARRSVRALRPQALEQQDLCEVLDQQIRKLAAGTPLRAMFNVSGTPFLLPADWDEHLLRICQEVLTNTLRHAQATEFGARLEFSAHAVRLELRDNGRGFNSAARHEGFGLIGIRERIAGMGGEFNLAGAPGKGTAILITLPTTNNPPPKPA